MTSLFFLVCLLLIVYVFWSCLGCGIACVTTELNGDGVLQFLDGDRLLERVFAAKDEVSDYGIGAHGCLCFLVLACLWRHLSLLFLMFFDVDSIVS
jgi:hypothetical protein